MNKQVKRVLRNIRSPISFLDWWRYQHARPAETNFYLITMNHGGTHWLRALLAKALVEAYGLEDQPSDIKNFHLIAPYHAREQRFKYNDRLEIPRIQQSHSPYDSLHFKNGNVILLVRDLRDAMLSYYRSRSLQFDLDVSFSTFLRGEDKRVKRFPHSLEYRVQFLNSWSKNRDKVNKLLVLKFEDLKAAPEDTLRKAVQFMSFPRMDQQVLEECVSYASLENMQKMEKSAPKNTHNRKFQKIASGKVGRYKEAYSDEDREYFMSVIKAQLIDDYGYDYESW